MLNNINVILSEFKYKSCACDLAGFRHKKYWSEEKIQICFNQGLGQC